MDTVVTSWIIHRPGPTDARCREMENNTKISWMNSCLDIEKVLIALLKCAKVQRDKILSHSSVLEEFTKSDNPFHRHMMTNFLAKGAQDGKALGIRCYERFTVYQLLDGLRQSVAQTLSTRHIGALHPTNDGTPIDILMGDSLESWYSLIIDALVGALKFCLDEGVISNGNDIIDMAVDLNSNNPNDTASNTASPERRLGLARQQKDASKVAQIASGNRTESKSTGISQIQEGQIVAAAQTFKSDKTTEFVSSPGELTFAELQTSLQESLAKYEAEKNERITALERTNARLMVEKRIHYEESRNASSQRDKTLQANKKLKKETHSLKAIMTWTNSNSAKVAEERDSLKIENAQLKADRQKAIGEAVALAKEDYRKQMATKLQDVFDIVFKAQSEATPTSAVGFGTTATNQSMSLLDTPKPSRVVADVSTSISKADEVEEK